MFCDGLELLNREPRKGMLGIDLSTVPLENGDSAL